MQKNRLEAFSDGVLAIIITIMVLELKIPEGGNLHALLPLQNKFLSYLLSFVYVGIYWNNHHHTFQVVKKVDGRILWANMHLLFWLSVVPFSTAWMGANQFSTFTVGVYGFNLLVCGVAYKVLSHCILSAEGSDSLLGQALGKDCKGKWSIAIYSAALVSILWSQWIALTLYAVVAVIWIVPDRRIERVLG